MKKTLLFCISLIVLLALVSFAAAEEAKEITEGITFEANGRNKDFDLMHDDVFKTYFPFKEKTGWLEIHSEEPVYGVYVMLFEKFTAPLTYDVEVRGADGEWEKIAEGGDFLVHWHPLEKGYHEIRLKGTVTERIRISELRLYGKGDKPASVQEWRLAGKCDMMLLTGHPDDELLWFAGLLPTYAGERGLRVQVAVMAPTGGMRKLELLHALWHCGVKDYPEFIGLIDKNGKSLDGQYTKWKGSKKVWGLVTGVIRKHQPEVLVTHGENGEYGHGAHRVACDSAKHCIKLAANSKDYPKSSEQYGTWQVKKLYLHEYKKNIIPCDWNVPLKAFGGKTGFEVAEEAFQFHRSQVKRDWAFERGGQHDNTLFGLYFTDVGPDSGTGDMMEHITNE